ncbi:MAG: RtcB family protein [Firmicutes bacterium]|nr:RtcB family protein [Bacillota bacterium]
MAVEAKQSKWIEKLERIDEFRWKLPKEHKPGMRVDGLIYANDRLMESIGQDQAVEQVANVAFLPGIVKYSFAMPDIHWGYGFPVGGVAATDANTGVVSPGGIGFDINCGVRLLRTNLTREDVMPRIRQLVDQLFADIPCGVGCKGRIAVRDEKEFKKVLLLGARWAVKHGYGWDEDLEVTEAGGELAGADTDRVSREAYKRGSAQLGTLGAGNHFLEVQQVMEIYDESAAEILGIFKGQVTILIHTGSRGLGHQICTDYLMVMGRALQKYGIEVPDRQLACAPVNSPEGQDYLAAMSCGANFAWANRQAIANWARGSFEKVFGKPAEKLGIHQIYDVAHNIAKMEEYVIDGKKMKLCIHRKGATRAFPPGNPEIPERYRKIGQPVLVPGDMGRYSFLLAGTQQAWEESFASTCHGAGRLMSRGQAKRSVKGKDLQKDLEDKGIYVRGTSWESLAEEAPEAYKDVRDVVEVCHGAGLSRKIARMKPLGVIKG